MIGRSGERGSGISVLAAQHDDDDDIFVNGNKFERIVSYLFSPKLLKIRQHKSTFG